MEKVIEKKQFTLNVRDFLKGIYVSVISPVVALILEQIGVGNFSFNWKELAALALTTLAAYLLKNFFQPTKVIVTDPNPSTLQAAKSGGGRPNPLYPPGTPIHKPRQ